MPISPRALLVNYLRPEWPRVVALGWLLLTGIGLQLANPQIIKTFIDQTRAGEALERLVWTALVFLVCAGLRQALAVAETAVAEDLGWRATNALRADLTRHVLDLDAAFFGEHSPGELVERIDGDVSAIADFFARFVVQVFGSVVFLIGVLILLWQADWRVGALVISFTVVALAFMTRGGGFLAKRAEAARQAAADLSAFLDERLAGLPDLKSSGADHATLRRLDERLADRFHRGVGAARAGSAFNAVVDSIFVLATAAALGLSAMLHAEGAITLGVIFVVFRYTGMLRQPIERLTHEMNSFQQATGGIVRTRDLLATRRQVADGPSVALPDGPLSVEFDRVSFAYGTKPALRDLSWRLEAGQTLGLLGRTGSGKTTISRLIFRLYDPDAGVIRLGGVASRATRLEAWRQKVGLVTQDVQLMQGSLRDNVALFDPAVTDTRLAAVFTELGLAEWLDALPLGLATPIGRGGRGLSAGEAQLVALARVFLKDPGVVILDEASSRLDPTTQQLLERAVTRLLAGRTGIIIAHRLATIERADQIMVLEGGEIVEFGQRADLARDPNSRFNRLRRAGEHGRAV